MVRSHHPPGGIGDVGCRMLPQVHVPQVPMVLLTAFLLTCHCLLGFHPRAPSAAQHLSRSVTKMLKQYKTQEFTAEQVFRRRG